ncbi:hypothetical protein Pmani_004772 [Petrolisthes manimaculis]|uniref:Uncharacterized protein n=1 Tax=Petrolisthes manimaculis TaxID=1843537 RepID=A0AAE1TS56_9EUCA|nr:hypothetical protein Pmani_034962 [Petrolisthes manimaculis]KAK4292924.1 hypothetical protein Pmani_034340 [Petrolisthes manimaculis]KAK4293404.1 hypothetical protein Pmani_033895 [Petrolisthes manimaculis]KAK4293955.1 hypothetical protein Pmani_033385 [Petrolisthes manimaculis]KAK4298120.1 hypothetical protein Pmani_029508 [Petrolisthes manimaculis]
MKEQTTEDTSVLRADEEQKIREEEIETKQEENPDNRSCSLVSQPVITRKDGYKEGGPRKKNLDELLIKVIV